MAVKHRLPITKVEGVAAGSTATIEVPIGPRYHAIVLEYDTSTAGGPTEANMEAEITEIRLEIDEITQRVCSAAQLFDINRTKGIAPVVGDGSNPGYLPIFFSEPQRLTKIEREATACGTAGINSMRLQVDIASGASSPSLKAYAIVDYKAEAPVGIVKWKRGTITVAGTGELPYRLDTTKGDSYQGLFFFENTAGDIDDVLLEWDGVKLYDLTENQLAAFMNNEGVTQVSKLVHIPLDFNSPSDAVPTVKLVNGSPVRVQEFLATLNMAQAANVTLIREMVGTPD